MQCVERRRSVRFPIALPVRVSAGQSAQRSARTCETSIRDISTDGASFVADDGWEPGDTVAMAISVGREVVGPYSYKVFARGTVVRRESDAATGEVYCAVAFSAPSRILHGRNVATRGNA